MESDLKRLRNISIRQSSDLRRFWQSVRGLLGEYEEVGGLSRQIGKRLSGRMSAVFRPVATDFFLFSLAKTVYGFIRDDYPQTIYS